MQGQGGVQQQHLLAAAAAKLYVLYQQLLLAFQLVLDGQDHRLQSNVAGLSGTFSDRSVSQQAPARSWAHWWRYQGKPRLSPWTCPVAQSPAYSLKLYMVQDCSSTCLTTNFAERLCNCTPFGGHALLPWWPAIILDIPAASTSCPTRAKAIGSKGSWSYTGTFP